MLNSSSFGSVLFKFREPEQTRSFYNRIRSLSTSRLRIAVHLGVLLCFALADELDLLSRKRDTNLDTRCREPLVAWSSRILGILRLFISRVSIGDSWLCV